ncbi:MAG: bifunctional diguanylate cyclase/phosphodiesterase [Actinomycetota bacterium]
MSLEIGRDGGTEVQIDASEAALEHQLRAIADVRLRVGADGRITQASLARPGDILSDPATRPVGLDLRTLLEPLVPEIGDLVDRTLTTGDSETFSFLSADRTRWLSGRLAASPTGDVLIAARDVTPEYTLQRQLEYQAFHDPLTDLPNRPRFHRDLEAALARRPLQGAVLMIDLDDFKLVNDVAGHAAGDELLVKVAERLRENTRHHDIAARLGGDEFAVLLTGITSRADILAAAENLHAALHQPLSIGTELSVQRCSIGVTQLHLDDTPAEVMRRADVALYAGKSQGKNTVASFDHDLFETMKQQHGLVRELERAIAGGAIGVAYQPIVELETGRVHSVETLARWSGSDGRSVSPAVFVRAAEEHGLIAALFDHMLRNALRDSTPWIERLPELQVHVNLSPLQMRDTSLADAVERHLAAAGVSPANLSVEITESVLALDFPVVRENLQRLTRLGVSVCLDDFGTGYSSLAYLQEFAPSMLKLDRSFVERMSQSGDARLPRAILGLATELEIEAVAEGIETVEEWQRLRELGWRLGQGYLMSRPVPAADLAPLLEQRLLP